MDWCPFNQPTSPRGCVAPPRNLTLLFSLSLSRTFAFSLSLLRLPFSCHCLELVSPILTSETSAAGSLFSSKFQHSLRQHSPRQHPTTGTMNSIHRQFGKLVSKGAGDNAKVSVLLSDYEDADKALTKVRGTYYLPVYAKLLIPTDRLSKPRKPGEMRGFLSSLFNWRLRLDSKKCTIPLLGRAMYTVTILPLLRRYNSIGQPN